MNLPHLPNLRPALSWQLPVSLIGIGLGFLLTLQFKAQISYKQSIAPSKRLEELTQAWRLSEKKRTGLEEEVTGLRRKLQSLGGNPNSSHVTTVGRVVDSRLTAGLVPVTGPGVQLLLSDSDDMPVSTVVSKRLNADDLLKLVNELRVAGAEAIALNGLRLISQSEIVTAGGGIMTNQLRLSRPYLLVAIGDPTTLISGLRAKGGILENLQFYATRVTISPKQSLTVPAYQGRIAMKYALPATDER